MPAGATPPGRFAVDRRVDGLRHAPPGTLHLSAGIAGHGSPSIPAHPASHGCARVSNGAMDHLWSIDALPLRGTVRVYRPDVAVRRRGPAPTLPRAETRRPRG